MNEHIEIRKEVTPDGRWVIITEVNFTTKEIEITVEENDNEDSIYE